MTRSIDRISCEFWHAFQLTRQPVRYQQHLDLAHCSSRLYRERASGAKVGQSLSLVFSPEVRQITALAEAGPLGRLYAADAAGLLLLFDFYQSQSGQDNLFLEQTQSRISYVKTGPRLPADKRRRYPKLGLHLQLVLPQAWPLFVILAILHLKDESGLLKELLVLNPWLAPLGLLQEEYRRQGHDDFVLPGLISSSWLWLTGQVRQI